jgi:hypothetical protein
LYEATRWLSVMMAFRLKDAASTSRSCTSKDLNNVPKGGDEVSTTFGTDRYPPLAASPLLYCLLMVVVDMENGQEFFGAFIWIL